MTTATRFWQDPEFAEILAYVHVSWPNDKRQGTRPAFDLRASAPRSIVERALAFRGSCPHCGAAIRPFRSRAAENKRGNPHEHIYVAATCPTRVSMGCSKGKAATLAYDAILAVYNNVRPNEQGGLL